MQLEELNAVAEKKRTSAKKFCLRTCMSTACVASQADAIKRNLEAEARAQGLQAEVEVRRVGCMGFCGQGPLVGVDHADGRHELFEFVKPGDATAIISSLSGGECNVRRGDPSHPFFARQVLVVRANGGMVDPESIEDYIAAGGFQALYRALTEMGSAEVVEEITRSGLRGRGGAGYPTGLKWATVAKAQGHPKYVVCNGDEGDPGAFMDRSALEADPFLVLEGMAIAAYAVGASEGYIYCRAEYDIAVARVRTAIRLAQRAGWLGAGIADSSFNFDIQLRLGAGAFVCGEETALIRSIEGQRGTPRPRPPYPAVSGLWGCPTLVNNVETLANVPMILRKGPDWFASYGADKSPGTKIFALAGQVANTGLIEVPMGMTLREIIFDIGGGTIDGRPFKAVQTGGPSGGCIPAEHLDMPVTYESLTELGSFMGSGGMIVMDDTSCMVDVAKYFQDFCRDESCGKCVPCRVGTTQMWMLLDKITRGEATLDDMSQLERLAKVVQSMSLCGLGQGAPNPVFSTMRFFQDEYLAHIVDKVCPAGVCDITVPAEVMA